MAFLDTLRRVMAGGEAGADELPIDRRLGEAWGINEVGSGADDTTDRPTEGTSAFDRNQWEKKLQRVLGALPGSRGQWDDLALEAAALGFEPGWVADRHRAEFALLVRRAVADRIVTEAEHLKLELARELLGIPVPDADALLMATLDEANAFFGKPVVRDE